MRQRTCGAAAAVVALGLAACVLGCGLLKKKPDPSPDAGPSTPSAHVYDARYQRIQHGKEIVGGFAQTPEEAKDRWHYGATLKDGRIVRYERVNPSGWVTECVDIEYKPDGSRIAHGKNAYGVDTYIEMVDAEGMASRVLRSGFLNWDGCRKKKFSFDGEGNVTRSQCFDSDFNPIVDEYGCISTAMTYGGQHEVKTRSCLGENDAPDVNADGIHEIRYQYNPLGELIEEAFFNPHQLPVERFSDGCMARVFRLDKAGNTIETTCTNQSRKPVPMRGSAHATEKNEYDQNGCQISRVFLDTAGNAALHGKEARLQWKRDRLCSELRKESLDTAGVLVQPSQYETAACEYDLNSEGLAETVRCFGTGGRPVSWFFADSGPAVGVVHRLEYDNQGRKIRSRAFHADGTKARQSRDYPHESRYEYAYGGLLSAETYYDDAGTRSVGLGISRFEFSYDPHGGMTAVRAYGRDDKPALSSVGYSSFHQRFDRFHRIAQIECLGVHGEPVALSGWILRSVNWPAQSQKMVVERDHGLSNTFLDKAGNVIQKVYCTDLSIPCYR